MKLCDSCSIFSCFTIRSDFIGVSGAVVDAFDAVDDESNAVELDDVGFLIFVYGFLFSPLRLYVDALIISCLGALNFLFKLSGMGGFSLNIETTGVWATGFDATWAWTTWAWTTWVWCDLIHFKFFIYLAIVAFH